LFFFFKQKTAYEIMPSLVGSEMCIRDSVYGCPLLREAFRRHRWAKFIAYERILRETRAGILEPMEALRYIKKIDKAYYSYFAKYFRNP